jgi:hypothetical protein
VAHGLPGPQVGRRRRYVRRVADRSSLWPDSVTLDDLTWL